MRAVARRKSPGPVAAVAHNVHTAFWLSRRIVRMARGRTPWQRSRFALRRRS
jgi:hypothetical protein